MTSQAHATGSASRDSTDHRAAMHASPAVTKFLQRLVARAAMVAASAQLGARPEAELGRRTGGRI
jgi:hypothetical protein